MKTKRIKNSNARDRKITPPGRPITKSRKQTPTQRKKPSTNKIQGKFFWEQVFNHRMESAFVIDMNHTIIMVNQALLKLLRVTKRSLLGKKCYKIFHKMSNPHPHCIRSPIQDHNLRLTDIYCPVHDRYFEFAGYPVYESRKNKREVRYILHTIRDITERIKAEHALKEGENKFRTFFDFAFDGILIADIETRTFLQANRSICEKLGYNSQEIMELGLKDIHPMESLPYVLDCFLKLSRGDIKVAMDIPVRKKNGEVFYADISAEKITMNSRECLVGIFRDITGRRKKENELRTAAGTLEKRVQRRTAEIVKTNKQLLFEVQERKKIEEDLRESGTRFRAVATSTSDLIWEGDLRYNLLFWHGDIDSKLGYKEGEFPRSISGHMEAVHPDDRDKLMNSVEKVIDTGERFAAEYRIRCKDGTYRHWDERGVAIGFEDGKAVKWVGSVTDITERKEAEEAIMRSEEQYRTIFNEAGFGIAHIDAAGKFITVNKKLCEMFGYNANELTQMSFYDVTFPEDREMSLDYMKKLINREDDRLSFVKRYIHKSGKLIWAHVTPTAIRNDDGSVRHLISLIEDITLKIKLEDEMSNFQAKMIHANKMTSLGTLVSGVAHEINNPNSYIMSNTYLLSEIWKDIHMVLSSIYRDEGDVMLGGIHFTELKDVLPKLLDGISEGSHRIKIIIDNLKRFSRSEPTDIMDKADLNQLVKSSVEILSSQIKKSTVNFHVICEEIPVYSKGNALQLEQVIINLIINALQALPDKGKNVWVSTERDRRSGHVLVKVRDEGVGIPEDIQDRITEPFFTTKLAAGGTGLGLSISYAIVRDHNGSLEFRSKPGKGTTVILRLPAYEERS